MFDWFKDMFSGFSLFDWNLHERTKEILNQDVHDGPEKDKEALASDWKAIGNDFKKIIKW